MKINQLADRFGSNRTHAHEPAKHLSGCTCVAVPFAGGLCEVPHFKANVILVNDADRHVMNLGRVVRDHKDMLAEKLDGALFHPDGLAVSQQFCREAEKKTPLDTFAWAYHYYVCSWMTRGGKMGTKGEFEQGLSVRWKSGGGDSVVRFRNAVEGIAEWSEAVKYCTFTTLDAFDFLAECKKRDIAENGIYADPPWIGDGRNYTHATAPELELAWHRRLACVLGSFENARIVLRHGESHIIRDLYPESRWAIHQVKSRTQANQEKAELLIVSK